MLGRRLRVLRQEQQETLSETAARAGISPQYLSEIERGRKEPSSEMIAALAGALGTTLIDLTEQVAGDLRRQMSLAPRAGRTRPGRTRPGRHPRPGRTRPGPTSSASPPKAHAAGDAWSSSRRCPSTWSTIP